MRVSRYISMVLLDRPAPVCELEKVTVDPKSMSELAVELFAAIHVLSAYPVPQSVPEIHSVAVEVMQQKICGRPCPVKAFYHPEWGVYLDEKPDLSGSDFDRSVLLHELVHHLQNVTGRFERARSSCLRNHLAKIEAYRIQNLYLESVGSRTRRFTCLGRGLAKMTVSRPRHSEAPQGETLLS